MTAAPPPPPHQAPAFDIRRPQPRAIAAAF